MSATDRIVRTVDFVLSPEVRAASDGQLRLTGYAAVFGTVSEDLGFREVLEPGCFRSALTKPGVDCVLNWMHDDGQPLARQSAGNLTLREDSKGLMIDATLPDTQLARDAVELVRSGVVNKMSFAFSMRGGRDREEVRGGEVYRYIEQVGDLHDVSLVTHPA
ncbi:MAG: uncharacterized protein QOG85_517, partial [Gaiellaceae bacterium]|nr:uncharacterized protein [Gaiellaceae bacterium]